MKTLQTYQQDRSYMRAFSRVIAKLRCSNGQSQADLSRQVGCSTTLVSRWEDTTCCPNVGKLPALATAFGLTPGELLTQVDQYRARWKRKAVA